MKVFLPLCLAIAGFLGVGYFDDQTIVGTCIAVMFAGAIWFLISVLCAIFRLFSRKPEDGMLLKNDDAAHVVKPKRSNRFLTPTLIIIASFIGALVSATYDNDTFLVICVLCIFFGIFAFFLSFFSAISDLFRRRPPLDEPAPELDLTSGNFCDEAKPDLPYSYMQAPESTETQNANDADAFRAELDSLRAELRSTQRELHDTQYELRRAQDAESKSDIWYALTRPRKLGCTGTLAVFFLILILFIKYAPGGYDSDKTSSRTAAPKVTATQSATAIPATSTGRPGIEGSNAYDAVASLKDMGYDLDRQEIDSGYYWSFSDMSDGVYVSMDITANKDYEICTASFYMLHGDNGFLYFGSTLPYSAADKDKTAELIKSDVEKSITIGDAVWTISPLKNGKLLKVVDVDFDAWFDENLLTDN